MRRDGIVVAVQLCSVIRCCGLEREGEGGREGGESEGSFKDHGRRISRERNGTKTWEQKFRYIEDGLQVWVDGAATVMREVHPGESWVVLKQPTLHHAKYLLPLQCVGASR